MVAGIASAAYQTISEAVDRRPFPPIGLRADVRGQFLHLVVMGVGSPTVVNCPRSANVLDWVAF